MLGIIMRACATESSTTVTMPATERTGTDTKTDSKYMKYSHDITLNASSPLEIFRRPPRPSGGTCNLCFRQTKNLKNHVSRHLQQVALFAIPRADYSADDEDLKAGLAASGGGARGSRSHEYQDTASENAERSSDRALVTENLAAERDYGSSEELVEQAEVPHTADINWDTVTDIFSKAREGQSELAPLAVIKESSHTLRRETVSNTGDDLLQILNTGKSADHFYTKVLSDSISGDKEEGEKKARFRNLRIVGAILILFNQLSTEALSQLLDIPKPSITRALQIFHFIINDPESQTHPIRLLHPSFRDFLLTEERCPAFWLDEKEVHGSLASSGLRLMSFKLKRDVCGLGKTGALASHVQGDWIEHCLPPEVQHACRYWVQYLERSEAKFLYDKQVQVFLRQHLLHWLEALSLLGRTSDGVLAISSVESLVMVGDSLRLLRELSIKYPRRITKVSHYTRSSMMPNGLFLVANLFLKRCLFKYIAQHWYSHQG